MKLSIEYRVQDRNASHFSPGKEQKSGYLSDESGIMLVYDEDSPIALAREEVAIILFSLPAPAEQQIDSEFSSALHQAVQLGYRCSFDLSNRQIADRSTCCVRASVPVPRCGIWNEESSSSEQRSLISPRRQMTTPQSSNPIPNVRSITKAAVRSCPARSLPLKFPSVKPANNSWSLRAK